MHWLLLGRIKESFLATKLYGSRGSWGNLKHAFDSPYAVDPLRQSLGACERLLGGERRCSYKRRDLKNAGAYAQQKGAAVVLLFKRGRREVGVDNSLFIVPIIVAVAGTTRSRSDAPG